VARDVRFGNPREPFGFVLYVSMDQYPAPVTAAVLRVAGSPPGLPAAMIDSVRAAVQEIDPNLRVAGVRPLMDMLDAKLGTERMLAILSFCFGALTLVLVSVGVYGVVSYAVQRRTQEIGIRLALGAARGTVSRMMMRDLAPLLVAGALFGGAGAFAIARAMHSILFGFAPNHYATLVAAALLLFAVAALAAYLPARRAARMDPLDALRQE
jgi:ABC-type antimicrobial peptide transport system permease subunit